MFGKWWMTSCDFTRITRRRGAQILNRTVAVRLQKGKHVGEAVSKYMKQEVATNLIWGEIEREDKNDSRFIRLLNWWSVAQGKRTKENKQTKKPPLSKGACVGDKVMSLAWDMLSSGCLLGSLNTSLNETLNREPVTISLHTMPVSWELSCFLRASLLPLVPDPGSKMREKKKHPTRGERRDWLWLPFASKRH